MKELTPEEQRKRHWELHQRLDGLAADSLNHHPAKRPSNTMVEELMKWSYQQTEKPDELPET